jgi:hypothetical protein
MTRLCIVGLFAWACSAQMSMRCSALDDENTRALTNKAVAKHLTAWVCTVANESPDSLTVWESSGLALMDQLNPVDHVALSIVADDAVLRSAWSRVGIAVQGVDGILAYLLSNKTFRVGNGWLMGATVAYTLVPDIWQKVRGYAPPVQGKIATLAWSQPLQLGPGESQTTHIFTMRWSFGKTPRAIVQEFHVNTSARSMARQVR